MLLLVEGSNPETLRKTLGEKPPKKNPRGKDDNHIHVMPGPGIELSPASGGRRALSPPTIII